MAIPLAKQGATTDIEEVHSDHEPDQKQDGLGIPLFPRLSSWKEAFAAVSCVLSLIVAGVVVFEPRVAVYWGQTAQFIWVGLCLTLMGWCAQLPLRRLFLISSTNSQASTLQSIDAILRSDPLTSQADWRVRLALVLMLALGPGLSIAYKSLAGGQSSYTEKDLTGQFGLTHPLGKHSIGPGQSQFVNATLPWFKDPGFNRVYGFNTHVSTENVSAMLDGPMPDYIDSLQASLGPRQHKVIRATVQAIVCEMKPKLDHDVDYYEHLFENPSMDISGPASGSTWLWQNNIWIGILLPAKTDNTNIVIGAWNDSKKETFKSHVLEYSLSRQLYNGSWSVSKDSVQLIDASPTHNRVEDHCLLRSNWLAIEDLYTHMLAEFDWRYRPSYRDADFYRDRVKSDSTFLASAVWSRIVAFAPWTEVNKTRNPDCAPVGLPTLSYNTTTTVATVAVTIKPDWRILMVLTLYPFILFATLIFRALFWPLSPIGERFGLVSLLASVDNNSLALLKGAGLSGQLKYSIFVGLFVSGRKDNIDVMRTGRITSVFETQKSRTGRLKKNTKYS